MALEQNELRQIAALLGDTLGQRVREAVAENVNVRIEALTHSLREDFAAQVLAASEVSRKELNDALSGLQEFVRGLKETTANVEKNVAQELEDIRKKLDNCVSYELLVKETTAATSSSIQHQEKCLDNIGAQLAAMQKSIPEPVVLPAPLVVNNELSAAGHAFAELLMKTAVLPHVDNVRAALLQQVEDETQSRLSDVSEVVIKHVDGQALQTLDRVGSAEVRFMARMDTMRGEVDRQLGEASVVKSQLSKIEAEIEKLTLYVDSAVEQTTATAGSISKAFEKKLETTTEAIAKTTSDNIAEVKSVLEQVVAQAVAENLQAVELAGKAIESVAAEIKVVSSSVETQLAEVVAGVSEKTTGLVDALQTIRTDARASVDELRAAVPDMVTAAIAEATETVTAAVRAALTPAITGEAARSATEATERALGAAQLVTEHAERALGTAQVITEQAERALERALHTEQATRGFTERAEKAAESASESIKTVSGYAAQASEYATLAAEAHNGFSALTKNVAEQIAADVSHLTERAAQAADSANASVKAVEGYATQAHECASRTAGVHDGVIAQAKAITEQINLVQGLSERAAQAAESADASVKTIADYATQVSECAAFATGLCNEAAAKAKTVAEQVATDVATNVAIGAMTKADARISDTTQKVLSDASALTEKVLTETATRFKKFESTLREDLDNALNGHKESLLIEAKVHSTVATDKLSQEFDARIKEAVALIADIGSLAKTIHETQTSFVTKAELTEIQSGIAERIAVTPTNDAMSTAIANVDKKITQQLTEQTSSIEALSATVHEQAAQFTTKQTELDTAIVKLTELQEHILNTQEKLIETDHDVRGYVEVRLDGLRQGMQHLQTALENYVGDARKAVLEEARTCAAAVQADAVDKLKTLEEAVAARYTTVRTQLESLHAEHGTDVDALRNLVAEVQRSLKSDIDSSHDAAQTALNDQLSKITTDGKNIGLLREEVVLADKRLSETSTKIDDLFTSLAESIDATKSNLISRMSEDKIALQNDFETGINALITDTTKNVHQMRQDVDGVKAHCAAQIETLRAYTVEQDERIEGTLAKQAEQLADIGRQAAEKIAHVQNYVDDVKTQCSVQVDAMRAAIDDIAARQNAELSSIESTLLGTVKQQIEQVQQDSDTRMQVTLAASLEAVRERATEVATVAVAPVVNAMLDDITQQVKTVVLPFAEATANATVEEQRADIRKTAETIAMDVAAQTLAEQLGVAESRLLIQLTDRVQREIDRLPKPKDGKDARVLAPVPYEQGKRYEQGAWVTHSGGVWVAARNTDAQPEPASAYWDCVVPGVSTVEASVRDDGRTVELHFSYADGSDLCVPFRLALPVVRGVYDENVLYDQDDVITWDGSWWVAQRDGKLPKPGSDAKSWKLSIKRGRDGKDLKQPPPAVLRFAGTYEPDKLYPVNSIVLDAGVYWLAMLETRERPPFASLVSNDTWLKLGS